MTKEIFLKKLETKGVQLLYMIYGAVIGAIIFGILPWWLAFIAVGALIYWWFKKD
jgi:hypothetical protein